jgi:Uma2 family endonuclease
MTALPQATAISIDDYLAGEEVAEVRHEFIDGAVHAMAGGTRDHSAIAANAIVALGSQLRGKAWRPFTSDLKIRIDFPDHVRFYYPDASVVCTPSSGDPRYERNPIVILEVLSESTRRIDQTEKRDGYFHLPSLQVLILADSERRHVLVHRRRPDGGFATEEYGDRDAMIPLPEIEASLALVELYEGICF